MKEYNQSNIPLAKKLRKNMTPWEKKLWYQFLREYPVRFQRQKAIDDFIVDFYCAKAKLVIEVDGEQHNIQQNYQNDVIRTNKLEDLNLTVIRVSNDKIYGDFENVCQYIDKKVKESLPQSPAATAPSSEGAEYENNRR